MGNNRFDENASCSDDTAISSLHKLFAYAESNVFARDFDGDAPSFSTDSVARNELKVARNVILFVLEGLCLYFHSMVLSL